MKTEMKFKTAALWIPSNLEPILGALKSSLQKNFSKVSVSVVDSPDLSKEPWNLASEGICGNPQIADVGGVDNINYIENHSKCFHTEEIVKSVGASENLVIGPGAGFQTEIEEGVLSELIANSNLATKDIKSKCAFIQGSTYKMGDYKSNVIGVLANLLITEGKKGKVIEVNVSKRTGSKNFVSCMREGLDEFLKAEHSDKPAVGIAGVFNIAQGAIKAHVMPDYSKKDLLCKADVDGWLQFYEMKAPLICHSIFVSSDPEKLGLRLEHTHFYSAHGDAGHYHYDVTPDTVEYKGYFVLCDKVHRVEPAGHAPDRKQFFQN